MPELTLQGILAITLVTTMLFDQFICYFCCAVQLNTSTVVDSAVLSGHIVFQPFVGRETAVLRWRVPFRPRNTVRGEYCY